MNYIMTTCIDMHNMIIEMKIEEEHFNIEVEIPIVTRIRHQPNTLREFIHVYQKIEKKKLIFSYKMIL